MICCGAWRSLVFIELIRQSKTRLSDRVVQCGPLPAQVATRALSLIQCERPSVEPQTAANDTKVGSRGSTAGLVYQVVGPAR